MQEMVLKKKIQLPSPGGPSLVLLPTVAAAARTDFKSQPELIYLNQYLQEWYGGHPESEWYCQTIYGLLHLLALRDQYTYQHSLRVAQMTLSLAQQLDIPPSEQADYYLSGLFHDLGKIGVPDSVLKKPTKLTRDEIELMNRHPVMSWEILREYPFLSRVALNAKHHHERFDGLGYPAQLSGENIPLGARLILICDTFDAMTSARVYRTPRSLEETFLELERCGLTQFDPNLVSVFIDMIQTQFQLTKKAA